MDRREQFPVEEKVPPVSRQSQFQLDRRQFLAVLGAVGIGLAQESYGQEKDEETERMRKKMHADRLAMSPDLKEAADKMGDQIRTVAKFMNGTYHIERAKGKENRIITVSELQKETATLNAQLKDFRGKGKKVRAADLWGHVIGMPVTPTSIALGLFAFDDKPADLFKLYREHGSNDALVSKQSVHLQIDENGFVLVDEKEEQKERPATLNFDTLLFLQRVNGTAGTTRPFLLSLDNRKEYWHSILVNRAKEYGFDVYAGARTPEGDSFLQCIDLKSANWKSEKRFLWIDTDGIGKGTQTNVSLTDNPPPKIAKRR